MNEPLKPCPFCNTTPILQHTRETGFYIHCPACQSYTHGVQWSREEALEVWNNRVDPWVRIKHDADGRVLIETLPKTARTVDITFLVRGFDEPREFMAFCIRNGAWHYPETGKPLADDMTVIAWKERPEPAVYEDETP